MKLINKIRKEYSLKIIRIFWCHWFNPIYTLYFNFVFFSNKASYKVPGIRLWMAKTIFSIRPNGMY